MTFLCFQLILPYLTTLWSQDHVHYWHNQTQTDSNPTSYTYVTVNWEDLRNEGLSKRA